MDMKAWPAWRIMPVSAAPLKTEARVFTQSMSAGSSWRASAGLSPSKRRQLMLRASHISWVSRMRTERPLARARNRQAWMEAGFSVSRRRMRAMSSSVMGAPGCTKDSESVTRSTERHSSR